jgi:hypothetical protein
MNLEDKSEAVLWALTAASCDHVAEEYLWPGGFLAAAREAAPEVFAHSSTPIVVGVNTAMIFGGTFGALIRPGVAAVSDVEKAEDLSEEVRR